MPGDCLGALLCSQRSLDSWIQCLLSCQIKWWISTIYHTSWVVSIIWVKLPWLLYSDHPAKLAKACNCLVSCLSNHSHSPSFIGFTCYKWHVPFCHCKQRLTDSMRNDALSEMEDDGMTQPWPLSPQRPLLKQFAPEMDDQNETNISTYKWNNRMGPTRSQSKSIYI